MKNTKLYIGIGLVVASAIIIVYTFRKDIANIFKKKGIINEDGNPIRETGTPDGKVINKTKTLVGDKVAIIDENEGFYKVEVLSDNNKGTIGWMYKSKITL